MVEIREISTLKSDERESYKKARDVSVLIE